MKKELLTIFIFLISANLISQETPTVSNDSVEYDIKASFTKGNIHVYFQDKITYPFEAYRNDVQGYVILSFIMTSEGKIDSILPIEFPSKELALTSILGFQETNDLWNPTIIDGNPVDWKYKIAFKYTIYKDVMPPSYILKANDCYKQEEYKKAIKYYSKAIKNNKYDYDLYLKRSSAKFKIGEIEESNEDRETMYNLYKEFVGTVEIIVIGVSRDNR